MKLKMFNGRGQARRAKDGSSKSTGHVFIGARSAAEAVALMHLAGFEDFTRHELDVYFAKNCWGDNMEGIPLQRGVWAMRPGQDYIPGARPDRLI